MKTENSNIDTMEFASGQEEFSNCCASGFASAEGKGRVKLKCELKHPIRITKAQKQKYNDCVKEEQAKIQAKEGGGDDTQGAPDKPDGGGDETAPTKSKAKWFIIGGVVLVLAGVTTFLLMRKKKAA